MRWHVDLPTLRALYDEWVECPPTPLALARIGAYLRAALGIREAPSVPVRGAAPAPTDEEQAVLASLPTRPMPRIMQPDEYLAMRAQQQEQAGHE